MGIDGMNIGTLRLVLNTPGRVAVPLEAGPLRRDGVVIIGVPLANPDIFCKLARADKAADAVGRATAPKNVVLPF